MQNYLTKIPLAAQQAILADASCQMVCIGSTDEHTTASMIKYDELASSVALDHSGENDVSKVNEAWRFVYDVMRVHNEKVMFESNHLARIESTYLSVLGAPLPSGALARIRLQLEHYVRNRDVRALASPPHVDDASGPDGVRDETIQHHMPDQNVKYIMWIPASLSNMPAQSMSGTSFSATAASTIPSHSGAHNDSDPGDRHENAESTRIACMYALYFIRSFFPSEEMYTRGAELALMYDAKRSTPHAKVVQSALRSRATALQRQLGVYEVLLVHGAEDHYVIPEGSRSNYLLVTDQNQLLSSSTEDILIGVTLLSTKEAARGAGLGEVQHRRLHVGDLCASKSFVTLGTSPGTLPVRSIVLYYDVESKHNFERMAEDVGMVVSAMPRIKVTSIDPPRAVVEYETNTDFLRRLRQAYENAAFA